MKFVGLCLGLLMITIIFSCNENGSINNKQTTSPKDTLPGIPGKVVFDDLRENLKLSNADTITRSASYFFSNSQSKDLFILKVTPGMVKTSFAELQIRTSNGTIIYTQKFDAFYFIRGIFEPDTLPKTGGQAAYETFMEHYWKAITPKQFEDYFKKSVDSFFTDIYPIESNKFENLSAWNEDLKGKDFWKEISEDSTIRLLDITCFDCDEGGAVIGYSRRQNKVVTLFDHD